MPEVVLVTGAAGFVGGHLLESLNRQHSSRRIVGWRRPSGKGAAARPSSARATAEAVEWQEVDVLDRAAVERAVAELRPVEVYHCAGVANVVGSWDNVVATLETNVIGTEHLLETLRRSPHHVRVLVPGSALVYRAKDDALSEGDPIAPLSPYGLSKLAQEMVGARFACEGVAVVLTRSFTHIGPGQEPSYAASSFAHQVARIEAGQAEPVIRVGFLDARRDLLDVRDTVLAYQALMARGRSGTIYNVCSGRAYQIRDVLVGLLEQARVPIEVLLDTDRLRPTDYPVLLGDRTRITADVGWEPQIALSETLRDILSYWRAELACSA